MAIRGKPRGNGIQLANYLLTKAENEAVHVFDIWGTSQPNDMRKSVIEMDLTSELTRSDKGLYHAQICPAYGEDKAMSREDWLKAAAILEDELKLTGQKRVIVLHEKQGRTHAHVVWERYDHEKGKMVSDSYSRLAQDRARQTMEKVLMHEKTPTRNKRQPDMKKALTEIWNETKSGAEFLKAAKEAGYTVSWCRGRRPFMVVDKDGRSFYLVRQFEKVRTKEVRERLIGQRIPTDKKAIKDIRTKQTEKSFTKAQEDMADLIETARLKREAKEEEQALFKGKAAQFKQASKDITEDGDPMFTKVQDKMDQAKREFKAREETMEQENPPEPQTGDTKETDRERRLREAKENFIKMSEKAKDKDLGLSL